MTLTFHLTFSDLVPLCDVQSVTLTLYYMTLTLHSVHSVTLSISHSMLEEWIILHKPLVNTKLDPMEIISKATNLSGIYVPVFRLQISLSFNIKQTKVTRFTPRSKQFTVIYQSVESHSYVISFNSSGSILLYFSMSWLVRLFQILTSSSSCFFSVSRAFFSALRSLYPACSWISSPWTCWTYTRVE